MSPGVCELGGVWGVSPGVCELGGVWGVYLGVCVQGVCPGGCDQEVYTPKPRGTPLDP